MDLKPGDIDPDNNLKVGSPAWRDSQDTQLDLLIDKPEDWVFTITPTQKQAVASAYKAFQTEFGADKLPDLNQIRLMVINVIPETEIINGDEMGEDDVVDITPPPALAFWIEFNDDMPDVFKRQGSMHVELNMVWQDYKLKSILKELRFNYMDWEQEELVFNIKSPSSLRMAANSMEKFEKEGFALFSTDTKDEVVEHYFRKGKVITP